MFGNSRNIRTELKFYIPYEKYLEIKKLALATMKLDPHCGHSGFYTIKTLYFMSKFDNKEVNGVFRIRMYNDKPYFLKLEKKIYYEDACEKRFIDISLEDYQSILKKNYDFLFLKSNNLSLEFYKLIRVDGLVPHVICNYNREAFVDELNGFRITFDTGLKAIINSNDLFKKELIEVEAQKEGYVIMELKFSKFIPLHINEFLNKLNISNEYISKYKICELKQNYKI